MINRLAISLTALLVGVAFIPGVDLFVTGLFYTEETWFFWRYEPPFEFVRKALPALIVGSCVFFLLVGIANHFLKTRYLNVTKGAMAHLLATMLLGPGLIVNMLLKEHWGRARPSTVTEFGGKLTFTPPFVISDQCADNCSFASGHAAVAFWTVSLAMLAPAGWRTPAIWGALAFGYLIGMVRVLQGAHFYSDVITAGLITAGIAFALRPYLLREITAPPSR